MQFISKNSSPYSLTILNPLNEKRENIQENAIKEIAEKNIPDSSNFSFPDGSSFFERFVRKFRQSSIEKEWMDLGLPKHLLNTDPDFVRLLVSSGMIYSIIGFSRTCENSSEFCGLDLQHQLMKVQGEWIAWGEIKKNFIVHPAHKKTLVSRGDLNQVWNYISPQGLVPQDRLHYEHIYPVHILSKNQYDRAKAQALKFLETNPEQDKGIAKNCIVQFVTSHKTGQNERFTAEHSGIRLIILNNGTYEVYSFGIEMEEKELKQARPYPIFYSPFLFTTVLTKIGMCDFEEFQKKEYSRITSIPLTLERAQKILKRTQQLSQEPLRFNYLQQNCLSLLQEVFKETGYEMPDTRLSFGQLFWNALPLKNTFYSILKSIKAFVLDVFNQLPYYLKQPLSLGLRTVKFTLNKISTVITNCFIALWGGLRMSGPLPKEAVEQTFGQNRGMITFSRLIRSFSSLIDENAAVIYHSWPFIQWQLKQPSTFIAPYDGRPKMNLIP